VAEQAGGLFQLASTLGHAVVQHGGDQLGVGVALAGNVEGDAALQALDRSGRSCGRCRWPCSTMAKWCRTAAHQEQTAGRLLYRNAWAVLQQAAQHLLFVGGQDAGDFGEVSEFSIQASDSGDLLAQLLGVCCGERQKGQERRAGSTSSGQPREGVCLEAVHSSLNGGFRHPL
jgi:hypothetical protein